MKRFSGSPFSRERRKNITSSLFFLIFLLPTITFSKPFIIVLDWFANPNHAPIFVAQQQGYFKQLGLDVDIITPANPDDPAKLVASQHADIALDYQPQVITAVTQGLPIVQIGALIATPLSCVIALKSSHINKIKDLNGKTIAGSSNDLVLQSMLENNGIKLDNVTIIDVGYNLVQALLSGRADAVSGTFRNVELIELQAMDKPINVFYPEENNVPTYSELVYIANKNNLSDPRLEIFLHAVALGVQYLINHPEESWQKFAANHPDLNTPVIKAEWFATLPRFALRPELVDLSRIDHYAKFMQTTGAIKKAPPARQVAIELH